jgi:hypothetical protein
MIIDKMLNWRYQLQHIESKIADRMQILQNKAIRAALGLPIYTAVEYIDNLSNVPKIKQYALRQLNQAITTAQ